MLTNTFEINPRSDIKLELMVLSPFSSFWFCSSFFMFAKIKESKVRNRSTFSYGFLILVLKQLSVDRNLYAQLLFLANRYLYCELNCKESQ